MKRSFLVLSAFLGLLPVFSCFAESEPLFFFYDPNQDPLAARDEYGLLHQTPSVNPTDLAPRHSLRLSYYFESGEKLAADPAYVGALQTALYSYGYYCGPIDGVFSNRVADAIARLQKNCSLHVTGTITGGVRRALHLP
jgi:hypothetical protein